MTSGNHLLKMTQLTHCHRRVPGNEEASKQPGRTAHRPSLRPHHAPLKYFERRSHKSSFQPFSFFSKEMSRILARFQMSVLAMGQGFNMAVVVTFWSDVSECSLLQENVLRMVAYSAAALASAHQIRVGPPPPSKSERPNISRHCQMQFALREAKSPSVESHRL